MKVRRKFVLCLALIPFCWSLGQASPSENATFAKYRVPFTFHGPLAKPVLASSGERLFRTRIREGAARGPAFADRYAVATWGCGSGCVSFALVDCKNGAVYMAPFTVSGFGILNQGISYRRNSLAIHIVGELNEANPADRWYVWDGKDLKLVSEEPAKSDPEMQP